MKEDVPVEKRKTDLYKDHPNNYSLFVILYLLLSVLFVFPAIPKVEIDPPNPGLPPNHYNRIPDIDVRRTTTTVRPAVTQRRIFPYVPKSTTAKATTTTTTTTTTQAPLPPRRITPPTRKPEAPTKKPVIPTKKPPVPTRKPYVPPPPPPPVTPVDNTIQKEVTKQRGDVHSKIFYFLFFF